MNVCRFIILSVFLYTVTAFSNILNIVDTIKKINFKIDFDGSVGGKVDGADFHLREEPLNNHGYFYSGLQLHSSLLDLLSIKTKLRVWNEELSSFDRYQFGFEPEILLSLKFTNGEMSLRGGYIDNFTMGCGLTVKDFANSGAIFRLTLNKWEANAAIFARGYGNNDDIYWLNFLPKGTLPLNFNVICINTQGVSSLYAPKNWFYLTNYLQTSVKQKVPFGTCYAEYGIKINFNENVSGIIKDSPQMAHAGLIGITGDYHSKRFQLDGCVELRAYQKGFMPVTGVDQSRFIRLWNRDDSRANWVDFFDSKESSFWGYLQVHAAFNLFNNFWLFAKNELLYFNSKQTEAVVYPGWYSDEYYSPGAIVLYKPSSNFYEIGVRYIFKMGISAEITLGNKVLNSYGDYVYDTYSQWGQRFIASDHPYLEVKATWKL